jgi:hypothetical protein
LSKKAFDKIAAGAKEAIQIARDEAAAEQRRARRSALAWSRWWRDQRDAFLGDHGTLQERKYVAS